MANLILRILERAGDTTKASPLTNAEVDQNFINLDEELGTKAPSNGAVLTNVDVNSGFIDGTVIGSATPSTGSFTTLSASGNTSVTSTTASTNTTSGALVVAGGLGVAGKINATDLQVTNAIAGSVTGNAATATTLQTARTINGVSFNGSANITVTSNTTNALTVNDSGSGVASGTTFNGATARTISYNSIGAPKADGTGATGTWGINITGNAATATTASTATTATNANNINISATTSTDTATSVVLVAAQATGNQTPFIDSGLLYDANTNALTAGSFVGSLSGNASTATALQTARTINGTSFDGTANITLNTVNTTGAQSVGGVKTFTDAVRETIVDLSTGSAIDTSDSNWFIKTITGATTFSVTNVPASGTTTSFVLELTNGGSSSITWWANVKWAGGTAPSLTASGRDVLGFYTRDGGTTWTGLLLAKDVK